MSEKLIPKSLLLRRNKAVDKVQDAMVKVEKHTETVHKIDIQIFSAPTGIKIGMPIGFTAGRKIIWGVVTDLIWRAKTNIEIKFAYVDDDNNITEMIRTALSVVGKLRPHDYHKIIGLKEYQAKLRDGQR